MPALSPRGGSGKSRMERDSDHSGPCDAPNREGFLNEASVAELAVRLGIGPRHLLRLFVRHTGATPTEVAATRRVQRAKRLIDETEMPMSEIAHAAGFRSLRRFNDAFRATYRRPPSSFRAI